MKIAKAVLPEKSKLFAGKILRHRVSGILLCRNICNLDITIANVLTNTKVFELEAFRAVNFFLGRKNVDAGFVVSVKSWRMEREAKFLEHVANISKEAWSLSFYFNF